jgi:hypothetical protein
MNVTRFMIRVISEEPLDGDARFDLRRILNRFLKAKLETGEINAPLHDRKRPAVTAIDLAEVKPSAPRDAAQAAREGFLREENPYPPRSRAHERWDRAWVLADQWKIGDE